MIINDNKMLFLEEARELLAKIETALLMLEKQADDTESINEVFRALHTIKGTGGMFGFTQVAEFTHSVENLFDELRKGKLKVDAHIIDLGLRSSDCIALLLREQGGGEGQQQIVSEIEQILGLEKTPAAIPADTETETAPKPGAVNDDSLPQVWRIVFKPQPQILHRGIQLQALFRELEEMGQYSALAEVSGLPALKILDPTMVYISWVITLATNQSLAAIKTAFIFVEDYAAISIDPVGLQSPDGESRTPKIGEILVTRGLIGENEIEAIRQVQRPFGEVAVSSGKVRQEQLEAALAEQSLVRSANTERETRQESATIRVRKEKLDQLIDLVGELVILHAILEQESKKARAPEFNAISENLGRLAADLRDTTMSVRMIPLEESFTSFQRLLRDLSRQVGKELQLVISGASTELDKNVIEALKDPLVHIIRNSADHGIEKPELRAKAGKPAVGTISLGARQVGARVEITVSDDGAGLDLAKIKARALDRKLIAESESDENRIMSMIFEPGFSTAEKTTGLSGRGVGMDVVKRNIEKLRGEVSIRSQTGQGMTITLSIPLTLVIIEGLLVVINGNIYVIALSQVQECVDLTPEIMVSANDESMINLRGHTIPVISLRESLGIVGAYIGVSRLVIVNSEGNLVGLRVDAVIGRKQVVIKPLSGSVRRIKAISGATILGDGSVALILDVAEIVKSKFSMEKVAGVSLA